MHAIILAAGKGERLQEITKIVPKPMIEFEGKPILYHNLELCKKNKISNIFINLNHLGDQIKNYFGAGEKFDVEIKYSIENELLGTSGAVKKIAAEYWEEKKCDEYFLVIYGDNYSQFNLEKLIQKLDTSDAIGVIAFHYREDVEHSGVAEFDKNGRIQKFIEKPKPGESESHWVNAGIYLFKMEILNFIPEGFSDFAKDIFPELLQKNIPLYGVCEYSEVKAFDTIEMYNKNIR